MLRFAKVLLLIWASLTVSTAELGYAAGQADFTGDRMPYDAFEGLPATEIKAEGASLKVGFAPGTFALPQQRILAWLKTSADAVSVYYGRFPVPEARILIVPISGRGVRGGTAFGYRGPAIRLLVGRDSTEDDLLEDWKAVHEMVHLALPDLQEKHLWLAEGLAVYVESIARVQAGHLKPEAIWHAFVRDMPQGLPGAGDNGLDGTTSWGRTYWGGAIFCLLADIEIRKRSGNTLGLQDAMRGVVAAGGVHDQDWPVSRIMFVADKAIGLNVMSELYEKMRASPVTPDLDILWSELGIVDAGGATRFDDRAVMAAVRRAITTPPAPSGGVAN